MSAGQKSRSFWTAVLVVCAAVAAVCIGILIWLQATQAKVEQELSEAVKPSEPSSQQAPPPVSVPEPVEPVDIPIDFAYLQDINEDIYGWIDLGATGQGYPVLSNAAEPDRYLHLDVNGNYAIGGSIYTQSNANRIGFVDPCTLIYGHDLRNGTMFGQLQRTIPSLDLEDAEAPENRFTLYTPTKRAVYRICAAGVFDDRSVLYYYDFSDEAQFTQFFADLENCPVGACYRSESFSPQFGDPLVILSTCYASDYSYRFLIVGVQIESEGE